jgi:hypothetical protein
MYYRVNITRHKGNHSDSMGREHFVKRPRDSAADQDLDLHVPQHRDPMEGIEVQEFFFFAGEDFSFFYLQHPEASRGVEHR